MTTQERLIVIILAVSALSTPRMCAAETEHDRFVVSLADIKTALPSTETELSLLQAVRHLKSEAAPLTPLADRQLAAIEGQGDQQGLLEALGMPALAALLTALGLEQIQNIATPLNIQFGNITGGDFSQSISYGSQSTSIP